MSFKGVQAESLIAIKSKSQKSDREIEHFKNFAFLRLSQV